MEMDDKDDTVYYWLFSIMSIMTIDYCLYELITFSATNSDSARYLLSALVQSQAAILALVVSLTIIAIQHSASTYSIRTIAIFRKSLSFWGTILLYIGAIIFELIVLESIGNGYVPEPNFSLSCIVGISIFFILIPYSLSVLNLLEPSNIIKKFTNEINLMNIKQPGDKFDKIQPVVDIVIYSLNRSDTGTAIDALNELIDKIASIVIKEKNCQESDEIINAIEHLLLIHDIASEKDNSYVFIKILDCIKIIGIEAAKIEWEETAKMAITVIKQLGIEASEKQWNNTTEKAISAIECVSENASEKIRKDVTEVAISDIEDVVLVASASLNKSDKITERAISAIEKIGKKAAKKY